MDVTVVSTGDCGSEDLYSGCHDESNTLHEVCITLPKMHSGDDTRTHEVVGWSSAVSQSGPAAEEHSPIIVPPQSGHRICKSLRGLISACKSPFFYTPLS